MSETLYVVDRPGAECVGGTGAGERPLWPEHAAFIIGRTRPWMIFLDER